MNPRARHALFVSAPILLVGFAVTFAGCGKDKGTGPTLASATVNGVVQNATSGAPIAGASVTASSGATATTDVQGRFSIPVAADQRVRIDVTMTSFSLNQLVVQLGAGESKSFAVGLLAAGTTTSLDPSAGGSVTDASSGAVLSLPADFVNASGSVSVTVTGLDPTTDQIKALPGGLDAIDATGQPVYLSPVSFAEYTVKDASGNVLQFNPSASKGADIELPIPVSLQGQPGYETGDPIECYVYDPADGKWKTPVPGVIGPSSVDGSPAIKATIFHLSWYGGAPASSDVGCIEGTVTLNDSPVQGVDVEAFPGGSARTDAQGHYRVQAALNSEVRVVAAQTSGVTFRIAEGTAQVGSSGATCAILDLSLGEAEQGEYSVASFLTSSEYEGTVTDFTWAYLFFEVGSKSIGVTGAHVQVGTGATWFTLPHSGGGYYSLASGLPGSGAFALTPGATYTIRIDFTSDGSYDASGQVMMVGRPEITAPAPDGIVPESFTAAWDDPGTSVGGYSAAYFGQVSAVEGDTGVVVQFVTTSRTKVIGNGLPDPVYSFPNDPLTAGDYEFELFTANGPYWNLLGDPDVIPNVTGPHASGYFSAVTVADPVNFASTGAPAAAAAPAAVRAARPEMSRWTLHPGLSAALRRAVAKAQSRAPGQVSASRR